MTPTSALLTCAVTVVLTTGGDLPGAVGGSSTTTDLPLMDGKRPVGVRSKKYALDEPVRSRGG